MATAYHRDQPGAPALSYNNTQLHISHFVAFKLILKACLVNGYGLKPAAGWLLINEGDSFIVLRTGNHSGYVCFTWVAGAILVYLAETYVGMSGDVMVGAGVKTGLEANNSQPQRLNAFRLASKPETTTWFMVADAKTFILSMTTNVNTNATTPSDDGGAGSPNGCFTLYAGEDSEGGIVAVGGVNTSSTNSSTWHGYFSSAGFTALKNPATGLLVGNASLSVTTPALADRAQLFSDAAVIPSIELSRVPWVGGGVYAGKLRGITLPGALALHLTSAAAATLGLSAGITSRSANTPIVLDGDYSYFLAIKYYFSTTLIITDNPGFW